MRQEMSENNPKSPWNTPSDYTGPTLQQAIKLCRLAKSLPTTKGEKLYYAKSTAMAKAAAGSWSRPPAVDELNKL
jgi:hypothetical protein